MADQPHPAAGRPLRRGLLFPGRLGARASSRAARDRRPSKGRILGDARARAPQPACAFAQRRRSPRTVDLARERAHEDARRDRAAPSHEFVAARRRPARRFADHARPHRAKAPLRPAHRDHRPRARDRRPAVPRTQAPRARDRPCAVARARRRRATRAVRRQRAHECGQVHGSRRSDRGRPARGRHRGA